MSGAQDSGLPNALNLGAWNASNEILLVVNDDQVFPSEYDKRLYPDLAYPLNGTILTINQIEPTPSMFNFVCHDFGTTTETFRYEEFLAEELKLSNDSATHEGQLCPFLISKKDFMKVGGWDVWFQSVYYVDCDMFLKLELAGGHFLRTHRIHLYHFGGRSTKMGLEGKKWYDNEHIGREQFLYKWGYIPDIVANVDRGNTKMPERKSKINGIQY